MVIAKKVKDNIVPMTTGLFVGINSDSKNRNENVDSIETPLTMSGFIYSGMNYLLPTIKARSVTLYRSYFPIPIVTPGSSSNFVYLSGVRFQQKMTSTDAGSIFVSEFFSNLSSIRSPNQTNRSCGTVLCTSAEPPGDAVRLG